MMKKIIAGAFALMVVATVSLAQPGTALAGEQDSVLVQMFKWWNSAFKDENGFTVDAFREHFTDDAVIKINNKVAVEGVENFPGHWRPIQDSVDSVYMVVPFEEEFAGDDKIFTHHVILAENDGVKSRTRVMGYAEIRDGKISLINFLRVDEPVEQDGR